MDRLSFIIAFEEGDPDLSVGEVRRNVQSMIDDGTITKLQGRWQRLAARLVENGMCHLREI
jgi:hypothetical protein